MCLESERADNVMVKNGANIRAPICKKRARNDNGKRSGKQHEGTTEQDGG